jgi:hypothetical protein
VGVGDASRVDLVTESPSGEIALIMSETRPWDGSPERLLELQNKLNTYYAFVESGELYERYPQAKGRPLRFQLDTLEPLDPATQQVAEEVERSLAEEGIRFVVEQYEPELVERVTAERTKRRRRSWRRSP